MQVEVAGTRLWFDVDGPAPVPDGPGDAPAAHRGPAPRRPGQLRPPLPQARLRPPGEVAQVVWLDLPGPGRSDHGDPASWSFERCADDVRGFCDALGIARPVAFGHSRVGCPTLVGVGALDPSPRRRPPASWPPPSPRGTTRLEVFAGAGHFTWMDAPDRYWPLLLEFVAGVE